MYDEKVSYRVGINWKDVILKIILIILFVLLLLWLFPSPQLDTFYDSVYNTNIQTMKDAAKDYYTVDRLPNNVGDSTTMTLGEMIDNKLIVRFVDKDNKYCDNASSFVQVTKISEEEYTMKVQLSCGEQSDYILSTIGCYDVCIDDICETIIKPEEPSEKEKALEYQHKKLVSGSSTTYSCPDGYTKSGSTCKISALDKTINATASYYSDTSMVSNALVNVGGSYTVYATASSTVSNVTYSCPAGYTLNGTTCSKTTNATYKAGTTTYSCPSGYTRIGSTCFYSINATANTGTGSYTCSSGYTLNGTTCSKTYNATYNSGSTSYSCPSGYNLSGSKCNKTYNATYTSGSTTYSCPAGYTKTGSGSSTQCYKSTGATSSVTYGSWYVVQNYYQTSTKATYTNTTEKLVYNGMSYDYTCATISQCPVKVAHYRYTLYRRSATTAYACPSGYTRSGTTCYLYANPTTSTGSGSYSCPSGGSLSGSTCTLSVDATTNTGTGSYSCPSGGSLSGSTCTLTKAATYSGGTTTYSCPGGYTRIGSICTIYTTASSSTTEGSYSCPAGYTRDGSKCYIYSGSTPTYIYNYTCPAGYTKSGSGVNTTCAKVVTGSSTYYCANAGETLQGDKCYSKVAGGIKDYSCPSGYKQDGKLCLLYKTESIAATASTTSSNSYQYKWSRSAKLEGWTPTGKTRSVTVENESIK